MWMGLYYKQFKLCSSPIDESEKNFSEEDGWEFITLADQVTSM